MGEPRVTVVCVPRDHHHDAITGLDALLADTSTPFELIYVIGRAPRTVLAEVRRRAAEVGFTLIERDGFLVPSHARNLGLAEARTEYVAFVDNDAVVAPGWLGPLVACADETGAAMVGPLQLIGPLEDEAIHLAGGFLDVDDSKRPRPIGIHHRFQGLRVDEVPEPLVRGECQFAEFHCLLARRSVLDEIGPFDEEYLSAREVEDVALRIRDHGGTVWFEPASRVTFLYPKVVGWVDAGFVSRRWSERANRQSYEHFFAKHDLERTHITALGFSNGLRRPIFGRVKRLVSKLGVEKLTKGVDYGLHRLERPVNRLLVRPGRTSY